MSGLAAGLDALTATVLERAEGRSRFLVALAGPPGVGKSTFSEALRERLDAARPGSADILPMDGFHYDDLVLEARGHRPRKGAPHTFDVEGFAAMLQRVREGRGEVAVPVFDRSLEIARAGARIITPATAIVLVEGNYLLLNDPRWSPLRRFFDWTVLLEAPFEEIERRLRARWAALSTDELHAKLDGNDLPNVRLVLEKSVAPDLRIANA